MLGHAKPGLPANAAIFEVVLVVFSQRLKTEITLGLQVRTGVLIVLLVNGKKKVNCIQPLNLNLMLALTFSLVYFHFFLPLIYTPPK